MRKNFKRIIALSMCAVMLGLTACGGKNGGEKQTTTEAPKKDDDGKNVVSIIRDIQYGEKEEPRKFAGSTAVDSDILVTPVEGITDDFIRGVDISSYIVEKDSGVVYKNFEGKELTDSEFFSFLADCGVNWVRVRVWNDPYNADGKGYGGGNNDIEKAVVMGKLASDAGMKVLVDFHYSDFWADPAKQKVPKAWDHKTLADKQKLLSEFTTESLQKLKDAGVNVGMVQMGNEINAAMAGETDYNRVYELLKSASSAIRAFSKDIKIAVHYANPERSGFTDYAGNLITAGVDYDVFGISYYPYWHGTLDNLKEVMTTVVNTYNKEVVVMETSYLYTWEDGDGFSNNIGNGTAGAEFPYEVSVQGQANEVRDVFATVASVGEKALGAFYWEPAWIPANVWVEGAPDANNVYEENKAIWEKYGSGWAASYAGKYDSADAGEWYGGASWDNQAMFGHDGTPLESLNVFKYIFGGTTKANAVSTVPDIEYQSGIGKKVEMPANVSAIMLDGSRADVPVVWDAAQVAAAEKTGAGDYTITGKATADGKEYPVKCLLSILEVNFIKNPGFEDPIGTTWVIDNISTIDRVKDNNKHTGEQSLKFWSKDEVKYEVTQKLENVPAGKYELAAYIQGGSAGTTSMFELFIKVNGTEYRTQASVTVWNEWTQPTVKDIEIPAGAEVIVGVRAKAVAGAWGAWDDFTLYALD